MTGSKDYATNSLVLPDDTGDSWRRHDPMVTNHQTANLANVTDACVYNTFETFFFLGHWVKNGPCFVNDSCASSTKKCAWLFNGLPT